MSNSTLSSNPDEFGHRYWSSFCTRPFAKGSRLYAYHGILNGQGPKFGRIHVIKIFKDKRGSERLCDLEIKKNQEARRLCQSFRNECGFTSEVSFAALLKAHMDETPFFACSANRKRALMRNEWVLIEERTGKKFKTYVSQDGSVSKASKVRMILNAFVHYTFHKTAGELVMSGLEGSMDGGGYRLKTPTVHSLDEAYGETDKGPTGIISVLNNHMCNAICKNFLSIDDGSIFTIPVSVSRFGTFGSDLAEECIGWLDSSFDSTGMRVRLLPTAPPPYDPDTSRLCMVSSI